MATFTQKRNEHLDAYFYDPLLQMSYAERLIVSVVSNSWMIVYMVGAAIFLLADIEWMLHRSVPQEYLPGSGEPEGNLAFYLSPRARRAIISAYNKATVLGGGFFLNLARVLSETRSIGEMLARLGVDAREFNAKLDVYLGRDLVSYKDKERLLAEVEYLVFAAFENRGSAGRSINNMDLFAAVGGGKNEQLILLFETFEINGGLLRGVVLFGRSADRASLSFRRIRRQWHELAADEYFVDSILELEKKHKVYVMHDAVRAAMRYREERFPGESSLGSVRDLIRDAAIYVSLKGDNIVRSDDVTHALEEGAARATKGAVPSSLEEPGAKQIYGK